jgi:methionyl-tRNA formyltransferase
MTLKSAPIRLVFAGTPEFALPCLDAVLAAHQLGIVQLVSCYSQPDRPAGRGQKLTASPIKQAALRMGVPIFTPESLKTKAAQAELAAQQPDLLVVVAYGQILTARVLAMPRFGCWNVHASLLPRWRGAAPIQRAIAAGDLETGVCLMQMQAGLDTGPVFMRAHTAIASNDSAESLHDKLSLQGAALLTQGLQALAQGTLPEPSPQPEIGVTYAHKLEKSEAPLDLRQSAQMLANQIRAFVPYPLAETMINAERVQILQASAIFDVSPGEPGSLACADKSGIVLRCGTGALHITQLKGSNGKVLSAADFVNGRPLLRGLIR